MFRTKWNLHQKRINHIIKLESAVICNALLANCRALQRDEAVSRDVSIQTSGVAGKEVHPLRVVLAKNGA